MENRLACQKVSETVEGVIADIQTSSSTFRHRTNSNYLESNALLVDCQRKGRRKTRHGSKNNQRWFVYRKLDCWSTMQPMTERLRELGQNESARAHIFEALYIPKAIQNSAQTE